MIEKGLIWTYYTESHSCYLFGKFDLSCMWMYSSHYMFAFILFVFILFIAYKIMSNNDKEEVNKNE